MANRISDDENLVHEGSGEEEEEEEVNEYEELRRARIAENMARMESAVAAAHQL